ncbi:hypothetical protein FVER14953_21322 [Fusarium verticillioides]|nr:hypothetical protein FVER14953_21322 [Fusarium verticillioides]
MELRTALLIQTVFNGTKNCEMSSVDLMLLSHENV